MKWTPVQQQAIDERNRNILVSAAAGSGKTAVLVERIKQLILSDGIPIDRMLVVTFSNAAAAEMRERIMKAIAQELERGGAQKKRLHFLQKQLSVISEAHISTFHKFAMEIIRKYYYLIDVEPGFRICDEAQKTILQAEAMDDLLERNFQENSEDFKHFLNHYSSVKNENPIREMIFETHRFIQSMPDPFQWLKEAVDEMQVTKESFPQSRVFAGMVDHCSELMKEAVNLQENVNDIVSQLPGILDKAAADLAMLLALDDQITSLSATLKQRKTTALSPSVNLHLFSLMEEFLRSTGQVQFSRFAAKKEEKSEYEFVKDQVKQLRDRIKALIKQISQSYGAVPLEEGVGRIQDTYEYGRFLEKLTNDFHQLYDQKKKERGIIDFNDIEHYALAALKHEDVSNEYLKKFDVIFVDEYQDSSIVQETLINAICRENNVYMVGDVKQSIYKFRLAEPEIFLSKYKRYDGSSPLDMRIDLNQNFRSKRNIIHLTNHFFQQIMTDSSAGMDYDDKAALRSGSAYQGPLDYPGELHLVDHGVEQEQMEVLDEEILQLKKTELEAAIAVEIIKEKLGKMIFDDKLGIERPVTCRDIVILMRGTKNYGDVYTEALKEAGIPAYVNSGDGYYDTMEIEVFLNLLKIIDNPMQDIPLISVLRSAIFGFTIDELIDIRLASPKTSYYKSFQFCCGLKSSPLSDKCRLAESRLSKWRMEAQFMALEDFLWLLMGETGYLEYVSTLPGGNQRKANLQALVDKAISFQKNQMKGLFRFITYINALNKNQIATGQVKLLGENDDVVRIMTIHKSKGLEFPIVLLAGLGRQFNRESASYQVSVHKDYGIGLRFSDYENHCYAKTLSQMVIEQRRQKDSLAEEMRILYVAFTRGMDQLILLGAVKDIDRTMEKYRAGEKDNPLTANCYLDWIIPWLEGSELKINTYSRASLSLKKKTLDEGRAWLRDHLNWLNREPDQPLSPEQERDTYYPEIHRRLSWRYPYKIDTETKSKFTVSEINRLLHADRLVKRRTGMILEAEALSEGHFLDLEKKLRLCTEVSPEFVTGPKQISSARRGTVLHKIMQLIPFAEDQKEREIQAKIQKMVEKNFFTEEEAASIKPASIAAFFRSDIGMRACRGSRLMREVPFTLKKDKKELLAMLENGSQEKLQTLDRSMPETLLIQGTIDCCFQENGKIYVIDYKTNGINKRDISTELQRIKDEYKIQINLYREALEKSFGMEVSHAFLYLFQINEQLEV